MIESLSITNFRCFKHIEVAGLKRINLVVGENSSGKSAFLESLFVSSGSLAPQSVFQIRGIRKMGGQIVLPLDAQGYRGLWEDIFFNFQSDKPVSIKIIGTNSDGRSLKIQFVEASGTAELPFEKQLPTNISNRVEQSFGMPQIEFTWKRVNHSPIVAKPRLTSTGMQIDAQVDFFPCVWFTPGVSETTDENAKRFSELDKRGESKIVLTTLAKEFPFIKDLSIDYHAGSPMVFAQLDGKPRKMPIPLISDGVNRLMGICLGIANFTKGMVLIDQIEDGFHHKLLPSIWNSIYSLAKEFDVQLFISTHSAECLSAILPILKANVSDFALLRMIRQEESCEIKCLSGHYLETALEQDFEVR
jgi:hypothetical protein